MSQGRPGGVKAVRVLRTPHSERYLFERGGQECASLDLHYHLGGAIAGTVVVFQGAGLEEAEVPGLLQQIDEDLLPEAEQGDGQLFFTVVMGRVLGSFSPDVAS